MFPVFFPFKCDTFCQAVLILFPLPPPLLSLSISCNLLPFLYPSLSVLSLSQCVDRSWPREASLCVRVSTSVPWTISGCMGLAASAARTSSREKWCLPWARPITPAASSALHASKKKNVEKYDSPYTLMDHIPIKITS